MKNRAIVASLLVILGACADTHEPAAPEDATPESLLDVPPETAIVDLSEAQVERLCEWERELYGNPPGGTELCPGTPRPYALSQEECTMMMVELGGTACGFTVGQHMETRKLTALDPCLVADEGYDAFPPDLRVPALDACGP